jgi:anti-sigma-K factor RskA
MDLRMLHAKLIAAARCHPPADTVPYAFEKRIMGRLETTVVEDRWTLWGKALWRSAFACLALAVGLSIWSLQANAEVEHDLESTMFAAADQLVDSW